MAQGCPSLCCRGEIRDAIPDATAEEMLEGTLTGSDPDEGDPGDQGGGVIRFGIADESGEPVGLKEGGLVVGGVTGGDDFHDIDPTIQAETCDLGAHPFGTGPGGDEGEMPAELFPVGEGARDAGEEGVESEPDGVFDLPLPIAGDECGEDGFDAGSGEGVAGVEAVAFEGPDGIRIDGDRMEGGSGTEDGGLPGFAGDQGTVEVEGETFHGSTGDELGVLAGDEDVAAERGEEAGDILTPGAGEGGGEEIVASLPTHGGGAARTGIEIDHTPLAVETHYLETVAALEGQSGSHSVRERVEFGILEEAGLGGDTGLDLDPFPTQDTAEAGDGIVEGIDGDLGCLTDFLDDPGVGFAFDGGGELSGGDGAGTAAAGSVAGFQEVIGGGKGIGGGDGAWDPDAHGFETGCGEEFVGADFSGGIGSGQQMEIRGQLAGAGELVGDADFIGQQGKPGVDAMPLEQVEEGSGEGGIPGGWDLFEGIGKDAGGDEVPRVEVAHDDPDAMGPMTAQGHDSAERGGGASGSHEDHGLKGHGIRRGRRGRRWPRRVGNREGVVGRGPRMRRGWPKVGVRDG